MPRLRDSTALQRIRGMHPLSTSWASCLSTAKVLRRTQQRPSDGTASPPRRGMYSLKPAWRSWARSCDAARSAAECILPRASCGGSTLACTNKMHTGTKAARVAPWRLVLCETRDAVRWAERANSVRHAKNDGSRYLCFERLACSRPCNPVIAARASLLHKRHTKAASPAIFHPCPLFRHLRC
jgi:hypothetical protein